MAIINGIINTLTQSVCACPSDFITFIIIGSDINIIVIQNIELIIDLLFVNLEINSKIIVGNSA